MVEEPPPGDLLFTTGTFFDSTLTCNEKTWKLHKAILCQKSSYFHKMLTENSDEANTGSLHVEDQEPYIVDEVLYAMYTGELQPRGRMLHDGHRIKILVKVVKCAHYFGCPMAKHKAIRQIESSLQLIAVDWCAGSYGHCSEIIDLAKTAYRYNDTTAHPSLQEVFLNFMTASNYKAYSYPRFRELLASSPKLAQDLLLQMLPTNQNNNCSVVLVGLSKGTCANCEADESMDLMDTWFEKSDEESTTEMAIRGYCAGCWKENHRPSVDLDEE
ncbi:Uu.00g069760.m01.CDS01 [Anthostomella pinea]|uniref:Uu.00g069760.m01.CDS01 n=1 Tax=Anthostomella pinea TaxID=933095 RepID=A0AAI8VNZ0_9PEZI|nr:Uu.00g069760.m01.CDS01 [Anthostomella pinea]